MASSIDNSPKKHRPPCKVSRTELVRHVHDRGDLEVSLPDGKVFLAHTKVDAPGSSLAAASPYDYSPRWLKDLKEMGEKIDDSSPQWLKDLKEMGEKIVAMRVELKKLKPMAKNFSEAARRFLLDLAKTTYLIKFKDDLKKIRAQERKSIHAALEQHCDKLLGDATCELSPHFLKVLKQAHSTSGGISDCAYRASIEMIAHGILEMGDTAHGILEMGDTGKDAEGMSKDDYCEVFTTMFPGRTVKQVVQQSLDDTLDDACKKDIILPNIILPKKDKQGFAN